MKNIGNIPVVKTTRIQTFKGRDIEFLKIDITKELEIKRNLVQLTGMSHCRGISGGSNIVPSRQNTLDSTIRASFLLSTTNWS